MEAEAMETGDHPVETVYVRNLNEKVSLNTLKRELESVFKRYGAIIQITAHKNLKMKGQAFITYKDIEASKQAVNKLNGSRIFDEEIEVHYAKKNSDNYFLEVKNNADMVEERKRKKRERKTDIIKPSKKAKLKEWESLPPNKILLLQNIKDDITDGELRGTFENYDGFLNLRLVKIRNLAFVEFDDDEYSKKCLEDITQESLSSRFGESSILTFAKK